ncbi:MAG: ABC transporter substrate-binding protein [Nitrospinaceae bacterium]|nr:ABC transporter substrate-binding protein [Nitrospinaceae bacterium]NIR56319.1 ABC transporter substrate-binding protein [Nitrospinaceae bacterium]NIS86776.1 ABC transporter substrate-binding protein [Nitrospinaceae bacterium]NIT83611.1 ABC transporter substrate-binding protein [Nitrospinaceae bacterium]NIU45813.1 ABC transporter substrate-binding protein [Nitrospinaceae bacterium]
MAGILCLCLGGNVPPACPADAPAPRRIVSLSPGITEILFAIGAGDRVVGVTDFCNYPEEATKLPRVGGILNPSFEKLLALQPDLIIHQEANGKIKNFVDRVDIQDLSVSLFNFRDIFQAVREIGDAVQEPEAASHLVDGLQAQLHRYQESLKGIRKKSVLLLLGITNAPTRDLYGVGPGTFLGQLLSLAGGKNILEDPDALYPKLSKEFILHRSPEVIIEIGTRTILSEEAQARRKEKWDRFPTLEAVQTGNIHFIGADYLLIPGPRLVKILDRFVQVLHPEPYAQAHAPSPSGAPLP